MHAVVTKPLDWFSIQLARLSVRNARSPDGQAAAAQRLLHRHDFLGDFARVPADFRFTSRRAFRFTSPVTSPSGRNNIVHGRLFPVKQDWTAQPTVILLHGWNAEMGYRTMFPYLARRMNAAGLNAAMYELPYHSRRKPRDRGAITNFLSGDLLHVVGAMHQALADARTLVAWLEEQGCEQIGVWGVSLGGWISGMLACVEPRMKFAVMLTPVVRMDRVIAELAFCRPIRRSLRAGAVRLDPLNLITYQPRLAAENILIVASEHDLFARIATIEELCQAWHQPALWRRRHGHISAMMSLPVMERTVRWVTERGSGIHPQNVCSPI